MNTLRIWTLTVAATLVMAATQSCLKNQTDYFDTSAAERVQKVIQEVRGTLVSPALGWRMEYYIGNVDQDRGGRNITMVFFDEADSVHIKSEEKKNETLTSWYKLTNDNGPVISFDTFNEVFHKYAVPSSTYYEARGGDFEFIIVSYSKDKIVLKGKRSGKISVMYPLTEPADDFIAKIAKANKDFHVSGFNGEINGKAVTGEFDVRNHQFTVEEATDEDDYYANPATTTAPYILTENGIRFYEPFEFLGVTFSEMTFNPADTSFTAPGLSDAKGFIPDDWQPYDALPGRYLLTHANGSISIDVQPEGDEEDTYRVTGISDYFDVFFGYDIRSGRMTLGAQIVPKVGSEIACQEGKNYVLLVPLSTNGYFGTDDDYGLCAKWNLSTTSPKYTWVDRGLAPKFITESIYLRLYNNGFVRDDDGYSVAPKEITFKGNLGFFTPTQLSKFSQ